MFQLVRPCQPVSHWPDKGKIRAGNRRCTQSGLGEVLIYLNQILDLPFITRFCPHDFQHGCLSLHPKCCDASVSDRCLCLCIYQGLDCRATSWAVALVAQLWQKWSWTLEPDRQKGRRKKRWMKYYVPASSDDKLVFLTSWNREEKNFWKTVIFGWNRNKISLICKQKCVFMESESMQINIILKALKQNSLKFLIAGISKKVALNQPFPCSLKTDYSFWKRLRQKTTTSHCLLISAGLFPTSQMMARTEIMLAGRSDWLLGLSTSLFCVCVYCLFQITSG